MNRCSVLKTEICKMFNYICIYFLYIILLVGFVLLENKIFLSTYCFILHFHTCILLLHVFNI